MAIEIHLAEQALKKSRREGRKITKYVISQETKINRNSIAAYWENKARYIDREALEILCEYFNCTVEDLIVQVPDEESDLRRSDAPKNLLAKA